MARGTGERVHLLRNSHVVLATFDVSLDAEHSQPFRIPHAFAGLALGVDGPKGWTAAGIGLSISFVNPHEGDETWFALMDASNLANRAKVRSISATEVNLYPFPDAAWYANGGGGAYGDAWLRLDSLADAVGTDTLVSQAADRTILVKMTF